MKTGIYWQDPKYALRPGRGFIFDPSLVLYLPLHKLDGASIMSCDAYGHLCPVTGALWTPRGRKFDGLDDGIEVGYAGFPTGTDDLTIDAWIYPTTITGDARMIVSSQPTDHFQFHIDGSAILILSIASATISTGDTIPLDTWSFVSATRASGAAKIYINTVEKASGTLSGSIATFTRMDIGIRVTDHDFIGMIGEVRIYNRALNPLEIQQNYLATKWRYQ